MTSLHQAIAAKIRQNRRGGVGVRRPAAGPGVSWRGFSHDRFRRRRRKDAATKGRPKLHQAHSRPVDWRVDQIGPLRCHFRHATAGGGRLHSDLRSHAAERKPRSGPGLRRRHGEADRRSAATAAANRSGKHHLSDHHPRRGEADPGGDRPEGGARFLSGLQPGTRGSRQCGFHGACDSQGGRRRRSTELRTGLRTVFAGGQASGAGFQLRSGRSLQDSGKHLSGGEHRAGERIENAVRPDGAGYLGSDRSGENQAVRLSGVLSGAGLGRALHSDRSVLSHVAGAEAGANHPLHRAGRRDQRTRCRIT